MIALEKVPTFGIFEKSTFMNVYFLQNMAELKILRWTK